MEQSSISVLPSISMGFFVMFLKTSHEVNGDFIVSKVNKYFKW